ncbi:nicotinate-nicotinamide nucleotide adenylyltransferase [Psychrobacter sp. CAL346-MNA-CIBAN-0220]|uniref:nicotinate-nicotinamide nucleotide adenylyltransferase n=1 Tax=Psychrobacter sp. CAL346-MNA-CIBAN-0220 TaxID=3140457 RepID=UPI00332BF239
MPDTHFSTNIRASKTATAPTIRAYLGGSFNPVHNGHIQMAMAVYNGLAPIAAEQRCALQVSLLPNARSPFKQQSMDPKHRLAMLKLAIEDTPLQISELELWQTPPVYSIDSVRTLCQCYPDDSLIFIMGMDSARSLEKWKEGLQLTNYVHLWIFSRSDNDDTAQQSAFTHKNSPIKNLSAQDIIALCHELPTRLQTQITYLPTDLAQSLNITLESSKPLKNNTQGRIYIDPHQVTAVSSTHIRQQLRQLIYEPVRTDANLTTKPNNLIKLINPTVYQYIIAHQLYSAAQFR